MRRLALIVLLSVFASFLGLDGESTAPLAQAAFPGGNGEIVFQGRNEGDGEALIKVVNPDGSELRTLGPGYTPEWSPDGKTIAFAAFSPPAGLQVFVMNSDGTGRRQVTNDGGQSRFPSWSPDGKRIAYEHLDPGNPYEIMITNSDGSGAPTFLALGMVPDWSPLGDRIAFIGGIGGIADINVVDVATGTVSTIASYPPVGDDPWSPDWSPDGQLIAFQLVSPQGAGIWVIGSNGSDPHEIGAAGPGVDRQGPSWSPDGDRVVFSERTPSGRVLKTLTKDGADIQTVTTEFAAWPDWQSTTATKVEFTQAIQQLQTMSALQSDLAGDGKPPVPIVAGKPAAMRVYFGEVQQATTYTVEVSGEFTGSEAITLNPGCDADQRRKQLNNCKSVDFYFTPPQGNWTVKLEVKEGSTVVEEHEFNLASDESDAIILKAVSLCDAVAPGLFGQWSCQDPSGLLNTASLLRRMLPTDQVTVQLTGNQVKREVTPYIPPTCGDPMQPALPPTSSICWWGKVDRDLEAMYGVIDDLSSALGQEVYYFGVARNAVPGGELGAAYINTHGAAAKASYTGLGYEAIPWVVAHEVGHAAGLDHTNTAAPPLSGNNGCWLGTATNLAWPYADNMLRSGAAPGKVEVGFDVANKVALPGDKYFDFSGYCSSAPPAGATDATVWVSPFTANYLLEPTGPLSAGGSEPQAVPASASAEYWLVAGEMDQGAGVFDPFFTFDLEGTPPAGLGTHRIEVRDASSSLLLTRMFTPAHGHSSPSPGDPVLNTLASFSELIPVQPGAALIEVFDGFNTPIGQIALGGTAPSVNITQAANDGDVVTLQWSVDDTDSTEHTYWVDYSPDGGNTWQNQAIGLTDAALALDAAQLAASDNAVVRVIASDGVNSGEATSGPFTVAGKVPEGEIIGPERTSFRQGDLIWLEAAAWDIDDGTLDNVAVTWSSSADGALGTGASLPVYDLSNGSHTITMTARDSDNNSVTDIITVTVTDSPLVEGEEPGTPHLWGDNDCDGEISSRDNQALSRLVLAQNPLSQTQPCPALGDVVSVGGASLAWGDLDCDGEITSRDGQALLRKVLAQNALSQTQPCPPIGDTVAVASVAAVLARRE